MNLVAVGSRVLSVEDGRVSVGGGSVLSSLSIQSGLRLSSKDGLSSFLELEVDEGDGDNEPVKDVGENGSIGGGRVPSQNSIEDHPAPVCFDVGVSIVDVPDNVSRSDIVRPRSLTSLSHITPSSFKEGIDLEVSDSLGEQTGSDEEQDAGGDDEEGVKSEGGSSSVDQPSNEESSDQTDNDSDGSSLSGLRDGDSSDEDDGLKSFSENRDEGKEEESPLPTSSLVSVMVLESNGVLLGGRSLLPVEEGEGRDGRVDIGLVESSLELDSPLGSRSIHSKEGDTHDENDEGSDNREDSLPDSLRVLPEVGQLGVEDSNERSSDGERDESTSSGSSPDLYPHSPDQVLDSLVVLLLSSLEGRSIDELLDEREQHRDNDRGLDGFSEDDEEDGNGEEILSHICET